MNKFIWLTDYKFPYHQELISVEEIVHIQEHLFEDHEIVEEAISSKTFWGKIINKKVTTKKFIKEWTGSLVTIKNDAVKTFVKETPQEIYELIKGAYSESNKNST